MKPIHDQLSKLFKTILPLLTAPAALLLSQGQAKAILNVNIFDDGPNLKITVKGTISGSPGLSKTTATCNISNNAGVLRGQFSSEFPSSLLCTGTSNSSKYYAIQGPAGFGGNGSLDQGLQDGFAFSLIPSSYSGPDVYKNSYRLDDSYVLGALFSSSATFIGRSLNSEGFTTTGLVGTWTIDGTSESINVYIGPPDAAPGPLPLLGAGAAFGWSRRLRKRIAAPLSRPPQA